MTGNLLWRGMLAGILAALLATLFARAFAEPQIDLAIAYEAAHAAHHAGAQEAELVSRETQKGFGLLTALALYGAAVGGIFALVFAYGYGRIAQIGPRSLALVLAALAFLLIVLVPGIKYPQTPPAVGQHETVGLRTAAYFAMIALSVCAALVAARMRAVLARTLRGFDAGLLAIAGYVVVVALGALLLPTIDEVPADFPAAILWNFRLASLGSQLLLWTTIGVLFGRWAAATLEQDR
ncbi:CbtA family protein [Novosphingobium sp. PS1R-30]|uniref:CbtA family protein n=1 Tax=Novosphingobium anseongense TaxID=3133436 RepID=A0ABU8RZS9_9SPHN